MSSQTLERLAPPEVKAADPGYRKFVEKPIDQQRAAEQDLRTSEALAAAEAERAAAEQAKRVAEAEAGRTSDTPVARPSPIEPGRRAAGAVLFQRDYERLGAPGKRRGAAQVLLG